MIATERRDACALEQRQEAGLAGRLVEGRRDGCGRGNPRRLEEDPSSPRAGGPTWLTARRRATRDSGQFRGRCLCVEGGASRRTRTDSERAPRGRDRPVEGGPGEEVDADEGSSGRECQNEQVEAPVGTIARRRDGRDP